MNLNKVKPNLIMHCLSASTNGEHEYIEVEKDGVIYTIDSNDWSKENDKV